MYTWCKNVYMKKIRRSNSTHKSDQNKLDTIYKNLDSIIDFYRSSEFNTGLIDIYNTNSRVIMEDYQIIFHSNNKPNIDTNKILSDIALFHPTVKQHYRYEFIKNSLKIIDELHSPEFIQDLNTCIKHRKLCDGKWSYPFVSGNYSYIIMNAAKLRYLARYRSCYCGDSSRGAEGAYHSMAECMA